MNLISPRWSVLVLFALATGCAMSPYEWGHQVQWNSERQILDSEESQVKVRSAQSRVFDRTDLTGTLEAVISTMQDAGFQIELLDEQLGIVTGKKFVNEKASADPTYHLYDDESLLVFTKSYRSWGPFNHRTDLIRLTVTVRKRNEIQQVVRASAQYNLRAIENPEPYQKFFAALGQALFLEAHLVE